MPAAARVREPAAASLPAPARPVDFGGVHRAAKGCVDAQVLAGVSWAVLRDGEIVHRGRVGWADRERGSLLREDHIFRIFSSTKLFTACAALLLVQQGRMQLDDPVATYLPVLSRLRVLRPDARCLDDTEPALRPPTLRDLFLHTAGFSYARTRPGTLLGDAYEARGVLLDRTQPLSALIPRLASLPLLFQPGTRWEYSVCTDVLARVIEVVSGVSFEAFLREHLCKPLGLLDTGFHVPPAQQHRLVRMYRSSWPDAPWRGGLEPADDLPYERAFLKPQPLCSGGGGLVSTLGDMARLLRGLLSPRDPLLGAHGLALLARNQLPPGISIGFPGTGSLPNKGFGFGGAITLNASLLDPPESVGEVQWGGIAGTHWWLAPGRRTGAVIMTQRHMGFWHASMFRMRREIYAALR